MSSWSFMIPHRLSHKPTDWWANCKLSAVKIVNLFLVLTKRRNDLKQPKTTCNDLKQPNMSKKGSETTWNKQKTTWNDLQRAKNDLERPTTSKKRPETAWNNLERTRNDMKRPTVSKKRPGRTYNKQDTTWNNLQRTDSNFMELLYLKNNQL